MKMLYQFSASKSFFHLLDPRTKLIFVICYMVATFIIPAPWLMFIALIAIIWIFAKIPLSSYWFFILYMLPLMLVLSLVQMIAGDKPPFLNLFGLTIPFFSQTGFDVGVRISFRLATTGMGFILFSMTTDPFDFGLSLYKTGLPYRISYMVGFALRFFPLLQEELFVIRSALQARAYAAINSSNPITMVKGLGVSVVPLGVGALRRSQDIALAMERRGLGFPEQLGTKRVVFRDVRLRKWDFIVIAISVAGLIATILFFGLGAGQAWSY